mgnify:FL=1
MSVSLFVAFFAGIVSFLSPCVLPLIPGYISFISGQTIQEINSNFQKKVLFRTIFFTLGFSVVFISLGATATTIGHFLFSNSKLITSIAGIIIIIFSLQLIGIINLSFLNLEARFQNQNNQNKIIFPFVAGICFGFGWTPCIGPILGSILALASTETNLYSGIILLFTYSLGLAIPFIISGLLISKFLTVSTKLKNKLSLIQKICGIVLLATGIGILTGTIQTLGFFLLEYFPFLSNLG